MPTILAMFPGQGSQYVGMGKQLLDSFPYCKKIFEEAEEAIHLHIRKLCIDGPEAELKLTANTQPCILTTSIAMWHVLQEEAGVSPSLFAGHSLGEYSALVASEKLRFTDAVKLVRERGTVMQQAVPDGLGAMAAVMKVPMAELEKRCAAISTDSNLVEVVNYNMIDQLVVAGHKQAVDALCSTLNSEGIKTVHLPVSAPFHSKLMAPAREAMTCVLEETEFSQNQNQIITNLTGNAVTDYSAEYLIKQIDSPVRWIQSLETANRLGVDCYIEIGPSKVLFSMARKSLPRGAAVLLASDDMVATLEKLQS